MVIIEARMPSMIGVRSRKDALREDLKDCRSVNSTELIMVETERGIRNRDLVQTRQRFAQVPQHSLKELREPESFLRPGEASAQGS